MAEVAWEWTTPAGVQDSTLEQGPPGTVLSCRNGVMRPWGIRPRPGMTKPNSAASASGACQYVGAFTRATDGTYLLVWVYGGEIYASSNNGYSTSKYVTTANFATAGVTASTTAPWRCCIFNGALVMMDGTNQPWSWDGTAGASGLTLLSNAPSAPIGSPTVYYGKLFFLADAFTLMWSEENDANTGYEAGGYNNTWTLTQSDSDRLYQILGANEGLYFFRKSSTGIITGAVTPDFATAGVQDAISNVVGTVSMFQPLLTDSHVWLTDGNGRPWALPRGGGEPIPVWRAVGGLYYESAPYSANLIGTSSYYPEVTGLFNVAYRTYPEIGYHEGLGVVVVTLPYATTGTVPQWRSAVVFDKETLICHGVWDWSSSSNAPCRLGSAEVWVVNQVYQQGLIVGADGGYPALLSATISGDTFGSSTVYPTFETIGRPVPGLSSMNHYYTEAQVFTALQSTTAAPLETTKVTFSYNTSNTPLRGDTPTGQSISLSHTQASNGGVASARAVFGLNGYGRWIAPRIRIQQYDTSDAEQAITEAVLQGYRLIGYPADREVATL